ncbi:MAG: hypothetical protein FJ088_09065, partial [Deltaproteobacteria bacterium]|nr:hypothetical protein [Deltaproteobacteria bacterium]
DGVCVSGLEQEICDDKNPCTYDVCEPFAGCQFIDDVKLACGDDNPCTMETCKPQEGCKHTPVAGECDDGNECTGGDFCEKGECKPGPDVVVCDDKNPCTYDLCNPDKGCVASFTQDNCNDNYSCTLNDKCMGGKCTGEKIISLCQTCEPEFGEFVQKMTTISLGNGGFKGLGLDIDGNPDTCAPYDNCSGGIDNELGKLGYAVNEAIIESVSQGYTTYLTELSGFNTGGFVFTLNLLYGDIAAGYENCDFQKEKCKYELSALNFDPECKPVISMDNAVAKDGVIKAGGKGYIFPLKSSLVGGGEMSMVIYNAAIEAEYILDSGGTGIESLNGVIGGAVNKQELMDTLTELPDWFFPYDKQAVLDLLQEMIVEDIDVEGDGINDAASIGIRFSTIQGEIVGLYN